MPLSSMPSPIHVDEVATFVNQSDPTKRMKLDLSQVPPGTLLKLLAPALSGEHTLLVGEYDPAIGAFIIQ